MASSRSSSDGAPGAVVISTQCSFETAQAFHATELALQDRQRASPAARDIRRIPTKFHPPPSSPGSSPPPFVLSVQSPSQFVLKTDAARRNDYVKTPYKPPSDFAHRAASPPQTWLDPASDFVAKFPLPSIQDLKSRTALDQEGFFCSSSLGHQSPAATQLVASDHPDIRRPRTPASPPPRPAFQSSVPHTTRKSASVALRIETLVDQEGLLPQLREVRSHQFRDDDGRTPYSRSSLSPAEPFHANFKAASSLRPMGGGS
jgi:hypothetical protein